MLTLIFLLGLAEGASRLGWPTTEDDSVPNVYDLAEEKRLRAVLARVQAAKAAQEAQLQRFPSLDEDQQLFGVNPAYDGFYADEYRPEQAAANRAAGEAMIRKLRILFCIEHFLI